MPGETISKEEMEALLKGPSKSNNNGNIISADEMKALTSDSFKPTPGNFGDQGEIKPSSKLDYYKSKFRQVGSPLVRSGITSGAAVAGATATGGNPLGGVAGGMIGDQAYQYLQDFAPSLFGQRQNTEMADSLGESAINSTIENIGNKLFGWFGKTVTNPLPGTDAWKAAKMRKNMSAADIDSMAHAPADLKLSTGQVTGSRGLQQVESLLGGNEKKHNIIDPAKGVIKEEVNKQGQAIARRGSYNLNEPYTVRGANAQAMAKGSREGYKAGVDQAYGDFRKNYRGLTYTQSAIPDGQGGFITNKVESPIFMNKTQDAAREIVDGVDKLLTNPAINGLDETVQKLQSMRKAADGFTNLPRQVIRGQVSSNPVMDWESAKINRSTMYDIYNQLDSTSKAELSGVFKKLKGALSTDMNDSIQTKWQSAARDAVTKANTLSMQMASKYDNKLAKDLLDETGDPEIVIKKIFDKALNNPEEAAKFVNAVGDKRELGAEYFTRAFREAESAGANRGLSFDGDALKRYLLDTRDVAKAALSAPQRAAMDHLSTVLKHMETVDSPIGTYSLAFRKGTATLAVGAGLANMITGAADDVPEGLKYGGMILLSIPIAGAFTKSVLLNPTNVRKIALLAKTPPRSQKAALLSKSILTTLKAAGAEIMYDHKEPQEVQE